MTLRGNPDDDAFTRRRLHPVRPPQSVLSLARRATIFSRPSRRAAASARPPCATDNPRGNNLADKARCFPAQLDRRRGDGHARLAQALAPPLRPARPYRGDHASLRLGGAGRHELDQRPAILRPTLEEARAQRLGLCEKV